MASTIILILSPRVKYKVYYFIYYLRIISYYVKCVSKMLDSSSCLKGTFILDASL